jgi:PAS domain S-box-containing protein
MANGIIQDITDRKMVENALKESESRFRNLFNNSLVGISVTQPSGKILEANNTYARMYGYESILQLKNEVSDIKQLYAHPTDREKVLKSLCDDGKMEEREIEVVHRDGSKFYVLVTANEVRDADGNFMFYQATHIDLTDRKKTEEKVRNASLYSRSLIEASLDPLITINSDGKITDVNMSTEEITGKNRTQLIGSDFANYFADKRHARKGYKMVFSQGFVKNYPLSILHKDGRKIDVLFNATLFRNVSGEIQGVLAAARDITELKRMEGELLKSKKQLENLNQHLIEVRENERSEIALNLHDDLGQRLTAINLDVAWLKGRVGVQTQVVMNKFNEISKMINETIDGIKEISSFLRPAILYDLGIVTAFEWQLRSLEKISRINFNFIHSPGDIKIDDRISLILYRVLQESLTNVVRHAEATVVKVGLNVTKNEAILSIEDNGKGIEEKKINALTSMGITGIKERVASVSGKVNIHGKNNKGTTVLVQIPLKFKSKS